MSLRYDILPAANRIYKFGEMNPVHSEMKEEQVGLPIEVRAQELTVIIKTTDSTKWKTLISVT